MLPKHPDQYSDEELEIWVRHLVDDEVSEGPRLDYKQTIALKSEKERFEAAKDISSFANEIGGTIIYGIPEDRKSDEIAIPLKPYGIDSIPDLESQLENIYIDSIAPHLSEWRVRKVKLTEYPQKVVYVAWVPESWVGVHMVEVYGDQRYYRRGQLRAVAMSEHEVMQRYERLRIGQSVLKDFLNSAELNYPGEYLPNDEFISHYVACPAMLFPERVNFATSDMRGWLNKNPYELWRWSGRYPFDEWAPFTYGVRAKELSGGPWTVELHQNGAISYWVEAGVGKDDSDQGKYKLQYSEELKAIEGFLQFARSLYQRINYFGPLHFQVVIENRPRENLFLNRPFWARLVDKASFIRGDENLYIALSEPSSKLFESPNKILKDIADEMFRAFGFWEADCFDDQLNLKRPKEA
jgi:hypothetical protein